MRRRSRLAALVGIVNVLGGLVTAGFPVDIASAAVNVQVPCVVDGPNGLIAAIRSANQNGGGTLQLSSGCRYTLTTRDGDQDGGDGLPVLSAPITIDGRGATIARSTAANTPPFRILHVGPTGTVSITALGLTGGNVFDSTSINQGGAIFNEGTITTLSNVTISGNAATLGGGVGNAGTIGTFNRSTISGNTAADGGGVSNTETGEITTLNNVIVQGNVAGVGGGIFNSGLIASLSSSTIADNRLDASVGVSNGAGGGIANSFGTLHMVSAVVARNTATSGPFAAGGGITSSGVLTLTGSLVSDNVASAVGGGIQNEPQVLDIFVMTVRSSQIVRNRVSSSAAGPAAGGGIANEGSLQVDQSTVSANTVSNPGGAAEGGGIYVDEDSTRTVLNGSRVLNNVATGAQPHGGGIFFQAPGAAVQLVASAVTNNQPENCFPIGSIAGCIN